MASLEHWDLMGKTGTVQNPPNPDHAWFAGIAGPRGEAPEIVVVVIVEFGVSGSGVAAPLMAKTADFYLRRKHGIPLDSIQTLGEHYMTGTPAPWVARLTVAEGDRERDPEGDREGDPEGEGEGEGLPEGAGQGVWE